MLSFQYYNPAKIVFGVGAQNKLKELLEELHPQSLLLVYSGEFVKELGIYEDVKKACDNLSISFYENGEVEPNPSVELVRKLADEGKKRKVDVVLAVGGGSSIDTAKAVAMAIPYEGDVWDFFSKGVIPSSVLPVGVISTLPASGSETSNCAIISNGTWKLGFEDNRIIPKFAIMNPEYTVNLPRYQTSCGVADILSHLLERYFSDVSHTDVTDYLIEGAVKSLILNGKRLVDNPKDINARSEIQWLASIAHNNLLDTGRQSDWGAHRIEHELSAQYGITHGEGMAVVMTAWIRYAAERKPEKIAQIASRVFHFDSYDYTQKEQVIAFAEELVSFFKKLGLKTTLSELGITDEHFELMADRATKNDTQTVGHYIAIDKNIFISILKKAL